MDLDELRAANALRPSDLVIGMDPWKQAIAHVEADNTNVAWLTSDGRATFAVMSAHLANELMKAVQLDECQKFASE